jgi:hypothetical protein
MDVTHFLKYRTEFVRYFYLNGIRPFQDIQNAIKFEHPPFDNPPFDDSGEPSFMVEWSDAELGMKMVGLQSISLLSDSLKTYFNTLEKTVLRNDFKLQGKRNGFVNAYRLSLGQYLKIDWQKEGVNFDIIEQVVLARNRIAHSEDLTNFEPKHDGQTLKKYSNPFFTDTAMATFFWGKTISVSAIQLEEAIVEIEKMGSVVDTRIFSR